MISNNWSQIPVMSTTKASHWITTFKPLSTSAMVHRTVGILFTMAIATSGKCHQSQHRFLVFTAKMDDHLGFYYYYNTQRDLDQEFIVQDQ